MASSSNLKDLLKPQWQLARNKALASLEAAASAAPLFEVQPRSQVVAPTKPATSAISVSNLKSMNVIARLLLDTLKNAPLLNCVVQFVPMRDLLSLCLCSRVFYETIKTSSFHITLRMSHYLGVLACKKPTVGLASGCKVTIGGFSRKGSTGIDHNRTVQDVDVCALLTAKPCTGNWEIDHFSVAFDSSVSENNVKECLSIFLTKHCTGSRLSHLSLEGSSLGPKPILHLCDILAGNILPHITTLNLNRNMVTETPIRKLKRVIMDQHCPRLRSLMISGNQAGAAVLEYFQTSFGERVPYIETFEACENGLDLTTDTTTMGIMMQGLVSMAHFQYIDLSFNALGDHGLSIFLGLCAQPGAIFYPYIAPDGKLVQEPSIALQLRRLELNGVEMASASMRVLSESMEAGKYSNLEVLSLSANALATPEAQAILAPMCNGALPKLDTLALSLNNLGDQGLNRIGAALAAGHLDNLEILDIGETGANSHTINLTARLFELRFRRNPKIKLRELKMFGSRPFANKSVHEILSPAFIAKVSVS